MKTNYLNNYSFFLIFFLTFVGYYAILLILFNIGLDEATRSVTVPVRLVIMGLLVLLIWLNKRRLQNNKAIGWFVLFVFLYCIRLFIEYYVGSNYYMSTKEVFFYFIGFCVLPFLGIVTQRLNEEVLTNIFKAFFYGGLIFSILSIVFYAQYIGEVGRLASYAVGEAVISPLSLSYSSALTIGVIGFYLLGNNVSKSRKLLMFGVIGLSVVPFFLGASRGSLVAIGMPVLIYFFTGKDFKFYFKYILLVIISVSLLIYLDQILKSGLLNRFLGISEAIDEGAATAIRTVIWKQSFSQFMDNPIFGGSLLVKSYGKYPHNIFLDVLQTTGLLGFVPFLVIIIKAWKACLTIFIRYKELMWVSIIFIQAFMQHMFSSAMYMGAWFWSSLALVLATEYYLSHRRFIIILNNEERFKSTP